MKLKGRMIADMKIKEDGAFKIAQNMLDSIPMLIGRRVHELRGFVDSIENIRACYGGILKSTNNATIEVKIVHRSAIKFRKRITLDK
jgi:hypothetical protein